MAPIQASKHVIFDVVGTLISYNHFAHALETRLGPQLAAHKISPSLLTMCWVEAAEREYTYLSLSNRYTPFTTLFPALWPRILTYAGVSDPKSFATKEDVEWLVGEWKKLQLREGARECICKLREAGFTVWCFTAGDKARIEGYFREAGVECPVVVSCDEVGVAKPVPRAYEPVLERVRAMEQERMGESVEVRNPWFAAAHMWDVSTARTVG